MILHKLVLTVVWYLGQWLIKVLNFEALSVVMCITIWYRIWSNYKERFCAITVLYFFDKNRLLCRYFKLKFEIGKKKSVGWEELQNQFVDTYLNMKHFKLQQTSLETKEKRCKVFLYLSSSYIIISFFLKIISEIKVQNWKLHKFFNVFNKFTKSV